MVGSLVRFLPTRCERSLNSLRSLPLLARLSDLSQLAREHKPYALTNHEVISICGSVRVVSKAIALTFRENEATKDLLSLSVMLTTTAGVGMSTFASVDVTLTPNCSSFSTLLSSLIVTWNEALDWSFPI